MNVAGMDVISCYIVPQTLLERLFNSARDGSRHGLNHTKDGRFPALILCSNRMLIKVFPDDFFSLLSEIDQRENARREAFDRGIASLPSDQQELERRKEEERRDDYTKMRRQLLKEHKETAQNNEALENQDTNLENIESGNKKRRSRISLLKNLIRKG